MCIFFFDKGVKDDDSLFKKPREVVYKNTRFSGDPFSKALNKSQIQQAAALNAQVTSLKFTIFIISIIQTHNNLIYVGAFDVQFKQGKVGPDGKELIPHESPTVNGYGYERTPSPAPGK